MLGEIRDSLAALGARLLRGTALAAGEPKQPRRRGAGGSASASTGRRRRGRTAGAGAGDGAALPRELAAFARSTRKTLVLDLDETLVHSTSQGARGHDHVVEVVLDGHLCVYYVHKRPHVDFFLEKVGGGRSKSFDRADPTLAPHRSRSGSTSSSSPRRCPSTPSP